jgi:hypothetical protein
VLRREACSPATVVIAERDGHATGGGMVASRLHPVLGSAEPSGAVEQLSNVAVVRSDAGDAAEHAELKGLCRAPRGGMGVPLRPDKLEGLAKRPGKAFRAVAHHRESTAMFGAIEGKGG